MVWYKAGSADDPPDKPGVAHFVEHATFAAMGDHNEDERRTTRGARDHEPGEPEAFTSFDYTAYYRTVAPEGIEQDRKSTRLTPVTNAHLVCRLLLEKKKTTTNTHVENQQPN